MCILLLRSYSNIVVLKSEIVQLRYLLIRKNETCDLYIQDTDYFID